MELKVVDKNKFETIEKIEKKIGCPIDVVFKALENGIVIEGGKTKQVYLIQPQDLLFNEWSFAYNDFFGIKIFLNLEDYKKTWCLKGETL